MTQTPPKVNTLPFRPIGDTFVKNGFFYELLLRDGNYAIFKQRLRPGVGCVAYEVVHIRVAPEVDIKGVVVPERETLPSNEDFGTHGWSYPILGRAKIKFHQMVQQRETK